MKTESEKFNSSLSSCYDRGKILIEDDSENGGGKGRVGEIIHRPAENLSLLNRHEFPPHPRSPPPGEREIP